MNKKVLSYLGLCKKAGLLVSGESGCENSLRAKTAKLVITACDASDNTKKKFCNKCFFYQTPYYSLFTKEELSGAIGEYNRSTVAVTDEKLANTIIACLPTEEQNCNGV